MKISLRYFASIRDLVGTENEEIAVPSGSTVEELIEAVKRTHIELMNVSLILVAVGGEYVPPERVLKGGESVALFPPVSGG